MADEQKPETTASAGADTAEAKLTQADVDRIVAQRLERERAKYSDYDELRKKAETLEAENKKRAEAEMSELQKLQAALSEKDKTLAELQQDREWRQKWEERESEAILSEMESLTAGQQSIINALPLDQRRAAIREFQSSVPRGPHSGKGGKIDGVPTLEELDEIRDKYGPGSQRWREAYKKYKDNR